MMTTMGRKRFKDEICCNILQVCRGGANKTQIVYSCNLNFHTVLPYLDLLIRNDLAEMVQGPHLRYRTTRKGEIALLHFLEIQKLIPEMELQEIIA